MITESTSKRRTFGGTLSNIVLNSQKSKRAVVTEQRMPAVVNIGAFRGSMGATGPMHGRKSVIQTMNTSKMVPQSRRFSQDSGLEDKKA